MGITYIDSESKGFGGTLYKATEHVSGNTVIVHVSYAALCDHGEEKCRQKGAEKHDNNMLESDGNITVIMADFL